jgi:hypothetical protein
MVGVLVAVLHAVHWKLTLQRWWLRDAARSARSALLAAQLHSTYRPCLGD